MFRTSIQTQAQTLQPIGRYAPVAVLHRLLDALVEADRTYREARKLDRLDKTQLQDMGIDPSIGSDRD